MKRLFVLLLALAMAFSFTACRTSTYKGEPYKNGKNELFEYAIFNNRVDIIKYIGTVDDVTIPSELEGLPVDGIWSCAFENNGNVKSVKISEGATWAGMSVFSGCSALESVVFPSTMATVEDFTFQNCVNLKTVDLGKSLTYIGASNFSGCSALTSLVIPDTVKKIGDYAFEQCASLAELTMGSGMKVIQNGAFSGCTALKKVNVNNISDWCGIDFYGWSANPLSEGAGLYLNGQLVTDLVIPEGTQSIGKNAFMSYSYLSSVTFPKSLVEIKDGAFHATNWLYDNPEKNLIVGGGVLLKYDVEKAEEIVIPEGVVSISSGAFWNMENLKRVTLPEGLKIIGDRVFNMQNLESINIPNSVTKIGAGAFEGSKYYDSLTEKFVVVGDGVLIKCSGSGEIVIPQSVKSIAGGIFTDRNFQVLFSVVIPEGVTRIESGCFDSTNLTSLTIPKSVTYIADDGIVCYMNLTNITYDGTLSEWDKLEKTAYLSGGRGKSFYLKCSDADRDNNE